MDEETTTLLNRLLFVITICYTISIIKHLITCTDGEELVLDSVSECKSTSVQPSSPDRTDRWTQQGSDLFTLRCPYQNYKLQTEVTPQACGNTYMYKYRSIHTKTVPASVSKLMTPSSGSSHCHLLPTLTSMVIQVTDRRMDQSGLSVVGTCA